MHRLFKIYKLINTTNTYILIYKQCDSYCAFTERVKVYQYYNIRGVIHSIPL